MSGDVVQAREAEVACEKQFVAELRRHQQQITDQDSHIAESMMPSTTTQDAISTATEKVRYGHAAAVRSCLGSVTCIEGSLSHLQVNECRRHIDKVGRKSRAVTQQVMQAQNRFVHLEEKARYDAT
jgi:hypothetical protein